MIVSAAARPYRDQLYDDYIAPRRAPRKTRERPRVRREGVLKL